MGSWYESCRITRQNDGPQPPSSRPEQRITVSLQRKPSDSQNMQHAQQPADSDAEAVVQYLCESLVNRKVCADTGGKHLLRALVIIKNTLIFLVFYKRLRGSSRDRLPEVSFLRANLPLHVAGALVVDRWMLRTAQCFETSTV